MRLPDRFWSKVQTGPAASCWIWKASKCGSGYGKFRYGPTHQIVSAHRVAYELAVGAVPLGMDVCHRCDNRLCVNPAHLFIGTASDNACDMYRKNRHPNLKLTAEIVKSVMDDLYMGFSQEEVGRRNGIHQGTVSRIKRGKVLQFMAGSGLPPLADKFHNGRRYGYEEQKWL